MQELIVGFNTPPSSITVAARCRFQRFRGSILQGAAAEQQPCAGGSVHTEMPSGHLLIERRNPTRQKKTLEPKCVDLDFIKMSLQKPFLQRHPSLQGGARKHSLSKKAFLQIWESDCAAVSVSELNQNRGLSIL